MPRRLDSLSGEGEAYWPGKNIMPANEGAFAGAAKPSGNHLVFAGDPPGTCEVRMVLAGPFLLVTDNRVCGGHNVSFSGIWVRQRGRARR